MNKQKIVIVIGIILAVVVLLLSRVKDDSAFGSSLNLKAFSKVSTSSAAIVTTSSTMLSATGTRAYGVYVNSGTNPIYLCLTAGNACTVSTASVYLAGSGGAYEIISGENEYVGAITAISTGGNSTTTLGEVRN